ncbi:hypothetical protein NP233_g211 [Leucocoprinus birnbaumii]|uniref:Uncharacterized protein n=1 Tax=Leucocoprinus birnbaumii TaxID=56174 RepID=A0AAD5YYS1_9AGAR|nr:hypothetical protein NP233_g211 [Leucocoprinus birnbaumii]
MSSFTDRMKNLVNGGRNRDAYKPVQLEEAAESRISLSTRERYTDNTEPNADLDAEASAGLLTRESDAVMEDVTEEKIGWGREEKKRGLRCCGLNLRNPYTVIGLVAFFAFVFSVYKLLAWAFYEPPAPPKGLENLPEFSTSLGCQSSSYFYNDTHTLTIDAPIHPERFDHGIDLRGGALGTITLTSASTDSSNVRYEITLRSNDKDLVQKSLIKMPTLDSDGRMFESQSTITTARIPKGSKDTCLRYDVKMFIPPSLKKLHLGSHTHTHVKFDENAKIKLETLVVTLYTNDVGNIVQASRSVKADKLNIQMTRGWLIGDVAIVNEADLMTQRGDAVLHVDVYPESPKDKENPEVVTLDTTTGAGRTNVVVHKNKGTKRPIDATHISSRNGPMEFTYKDYGLDGLIAVESKELENIGMERLVAGEQDGEQWNYYVGGKDGKDRVRVNTRGWVGLFF